MRRAKKIILYKYQVYKYLILQFSRYLNLRKTSGFLFLTFRVFKEDHSKLKFFGEKVCHFILLLVYNPRVSFVLTLLFLLLFKKSLLYPLFFCSVLEKVCKYFKWHERIDTIYKRGMLKDFYLKKTFLLRKRNKRK